MSERRPSYEELLAENQELRARVSKLEARIEELEEVVRKLLGQLGQFGLNSQNSSKPPSSDPPWMPKSQREKSDKAQGGQRGHKGETLKMVAEPDRVEYHRLEGLCSCGRDLRKAQLLGIARRQVVELPPIRAEVIEHRVEERVCRCGKMQQASFPEGVNSLVQYGPRIQAIGTYFLMGQLLPYERTQQTMQELFGVGLSQGSLYEHLKKAYEGLEDVETQIVNALVQSPVLHGDETGYSQRGERGWWQVLSTTKLTYYHASMQRGIQSWWQQGAWLLFTGVLVHDFFKSYFNLSGSLLHALCNAHILRELQRVEQQFAQPWATQMKALLKATKAEVEALNPPQLSPQRLKEVHQQYTALLEQAKQANPPPQRPAHNHKRGRIKQTFARNLVGRLEAHQHDILRFASEAAVPFDNNLAERDLRMVKLKEKISGTARGQGATYFARIRGYISTLRKQDLPILDALEALFRGQPLMPQLAE